MRTSVNRIFALAAISTLALSVPSVTVSAQTPAERPQFPPPKPEVQPPAVESNLVVSINVLVFGGDAHIREGGLS